MVKTITKKMRKTLKRMRQSLKKVGKSLNKKRQSLKKVGKSLNKKRQSLKSKSKNMRGGANVPKFRPGGNTGGPYKPVGTTVQPTKSALKGSTGKTFVNSTGKTTILPVNSNVANRRIVVLPENESTHQYRKTQQSTNENRLGLNPAGYQSKTTKPKRSVGWSNQPSTKESIANLIAQAQRVKNQRTEAQREYKAGTTTTYNSGLEVSNH